MIAALILSDLLRAQLAAEARAAFPRECCGLIEGRIERPTLHVTALHPTRNLSDAVDRFEIDPAEHIRLLRMLRGTGRDILGCYHSHPNGRAEPSDTDRDRAIDEGFVWLVQPLTATAASAPAAYVFGEGRFMPLMLG